MALLASLLVLWPIVFQPLLNVGWSLTTFTGLSYSVGDVLLLGLLAVYLGDVAAIADVRDRFDRADRLTSERFDRAFAELARIGLLEVGPPIGANGGAAGAGIMRIKRDSPLPEVPELA